MMTKKDYQLARQKMYRALEDFFNEHGFTQVEVPNLSEYLIPENHIARFSTVQTSPYRADKALFLLPSSEVYVKPLLAEGWGDLYCISRCYRNSEQEGRIHNPEFSMIEYYLTNGNYQDSLALTQALFSELAKLFPTTKLARPIEIISIQQAFMRYAGINLLKACQEGCLWDEVDKLGLHPDKEADLEELYNLVVVARIEEALPHDRPVVLIDFPSFVPTTAALCKNPFWSQRWELYVDGVELCNCYTERTSAAEMMDYIKADLSLPEGEALNEADVRYCRLLDKLPPCSGNAMGLDRLLMVLTGAKTIQETLLFPEKSPFNV